METITVIRGKVKFLREGIDKRDRINLEYYYCAIICGRDNVNSGLLFVALPKYLADKVKKTEKKDLAPGYDKEKEITKPLFGEFQVFKDFMINLRPVFDREGSPSSNDIEYMVNELGQLEEDPYPYKDLLVVSDFKEIKDVFYRKEFILLGHKY